MDKLLHRLNFSVYYTLDATAWYEAYYVFEGVSFVVAFLGLAVGGVSLYVFLTIPQFHKHFLYVMYNVYANFVFMTLTRQAVVFAIWWTRNDSNEYQTQLLSLTRFKWLEDLKLMSMVNHNMIIYVIILERTYATVHAKVYEHKTMPLYCLVMFLTPWIVSFIGVYTLMLGYGPVVPLVVLCCLISYPIYGGYYYVSRMNRRRYLLSKSMNTAYTLSERFQLSENLRTTPIINRIIQSAIVLNTPCYIVITAMMFLENVNAKLICKMIFDFVCLVYPFVMNASIALSNDRWKWKMFNILKTPFKLARVDVYMPSTKTVQGHEMIVVKRRETDVYFDQLKDSWA